jgi:hypothetical protein
MVYRSLETDSRKVARQRRDIFAAADDQRWSEIAPSRFGAPSRDAILQDLKLRAESFGVIYAPAQQLAQTASLEELLKRVAAITPQATPIPQKVQRDMDAVLGLAERSVVTITQAMDIYLSEIALDEVAGKSPEQVASYVKVKRRAVANFVKLNGDVDMCEIERDHGRKVYQHWAAKVHPKDGAKPMSGSSANRDLGNLRKLYRRYFEHIGEEDRQNPFRIGSERIRVSWATEDENIDRSHSPSVSHMPQAAKQKAKECSQSSVGKPTEISMPVCQ